MTRSPDVNPITKARVGASRVSMRISTPPRVHRSVACAVNTRLARFPASSTSTRPVVILIALEPNAATLTASTWLKVSWGSAVP
jgi:hypothetical protein